MANRQDVQMLQEALQGLGQGFAQRRQQSAEHDTEMQKLALESQLRDIQQSRYDAQGEHFNKMEAGQQDYYNKVLENQKLAQSKQDDKATQVASQEDMKNKQSLLQTVIGLNATGQLSDDDRDNVNDWIAKDEHLGTTGIQLQAPDPKFQKGQNKQPATVAALNSAADFRKQAQETKDPDEATRLNDYANWTESWVKKQGTFASQVPKPTENVTNQFNALGNKVSSQKSFAAPPAPPAPPSSILPQKLPLTMGAPNAPLNSASDVRSAYANNPPLISSDDAENMINSQFSSQLPSVPGGGGMPVSTSASLPTPNPSEIPRLTKDGRTAIYDANTKQFLRYADSTP